MENVISHCHRAQEHSTEENKSLASQPREQNNLCKHFNNIGIILLHSQIYIGNFHLCYHIYGFILQACYIFQQSIHCL